MLVLESMRAAGVPALSVGPDSCSFCLTGKLLASSGRKPGLCMVSLFILCCESEAGSPAGNRKSGIWFGEDLGDLLWPIAGVTGAVEDPGKRPNRSGGYEALYKGELICLVLEFPAMCQLWLPRTAHASVLTRLMTCQQRGLASW
jgi:hypothetical protein